MARLIVENKHNFDDSKTPDRHGHIVYLNKTADGESDGLPDCEGVEEFNDGLEPDELRSDSFENRKGADITVKFLVRNGFITEDEAMKLFDDIAQSKLPAEQTALKNPTRE